MAFGDIRTNSIISSNILQSYKLTNVNIGQLYDNPITISTGSQFFLCAYIERKTLSSNTPSVTNNNVITKQIVGGTHEQTIFNISSYSSQSSFIHRTFNLYTKENDVLVLTTEERDVDFNGTYDFTFYYLTNSVEGGRFGSISSEGSSVLKTIRSDQFTFTQSQMANLATTPITLVDSPSPNTYIYTLNVVLNGLSESGANIRVGYKNLSNIVEDGFAINNGNRIGHEAHHLHSYGLSNPQGIGRDLVLYGDSNQSNSTGEVDVVVDYVVLELDSSYGRFGAIRSGDNIIDPVDEISSSSVTLSDSDFKTMNTSPIEIAPMPVNGDVYYTHVYTIIKFNDVVTIPTDGTYQFTIVYAFFGGGTYEATYFNTWRIILGSGIGDSNTVYATINNTDNTVVIQHPTTHDKATGFVMNGRGLYLRSNINNPNFDFGNAELITYYSTGVTTPPDLPPTAPSNITISQVFNTTNFEVEWNDNSNNETYFQIESQTNNGLWAIVGSVGANVTYFYDNTSYTVNDFIRFRVKAVNTSTGSSAYATSLGLTVQGGGFG